MPPHKDTPKGTIQTLNIIIKSLTDLKANVDKGDAVVHITITHTNEISRGATPPMVTFEALSTGRHQIRYSMEIINILEAEAFQARSKEWTIFADTPSMMDPPLAEPDYR